MYIYIIYIYRHLRATLTHLIFFLFSVFYRSPVISTGNMNFFVTFLYTPLVNYFINKLKNLTKKNSYFQLKLQESGKKMKMKKCKNVKVVRTSKCKIRQSCRDVTI